MFNIFMSRSVLLKGVDISLHFGQKTLLDEVNFDFKEGDIVGIVGRNGSGKSTILKIIAGVLEPDIGKLEFNPSLEVCYMPQEIEFESGLSSFEYLAKSWFEVKMKSKSSELSFVADIADQPVPWKLIDKTKHEFLIEKITESAKAFNIVNLHGDIDNLSGGEKRKVALARFILNQPDVLILDEPTNHLDIQSIERLELALKAFTGAVVLVSHDRYFLDKVATRMIEIHDSKLFSHRGNYQKFLEDKSIRLEIESTQEENRQAFLKRELSWVRAGVQGRGVKDKGRMQRFHDLKNQKKPLDDQNLELLLPKITPLGNKILIFEEVCLSVGNTINPDKIVKQVQGDTNVQINHQLDVPKSIIKNLNFTFQPGFRLGLVGPNGSGKTTLIKAILGQTEVQSGKITVGKNTCFNYQDQEKMSLDLEKSPLEEIGHGQESTTFGDGLISTRGYLRRLLFSNQQIMTKIKHFSGGEKARILLAKTLKEGGNFLILDEPTNDLDLETIRLLEESLLNFAGVALIVSHDRYFLNRVCTHLLSLEENGEYILISGDYDDLMARKKPLNQGVLPELSTSSAKTVEKPSVSFREIRQRDKEVRTLEKQIETLEKRISEYEQEFAQPDFYTQKSEKIDQKYKEHIDLKQKLDTLMQKWELVSQ
jgi:ATP-binding cassette subfamily F protein uup